MAFISQISSEDTLGLWRKAKFMKKKNILKPFQSLVKNDRRKWLKRFFFLAGGQLLCHTQGHLAILRLVSSLNPSPRHTTTTDFSFWQAFKNGSTFFCVFFLQHSKRVATEKTSEGKISIHLSKQPTLWHGSWASTLSQSQAELFHSLAAQRVDLQCLRLRVIFLYTLSSYKYDWKPTNSCWSSCCPLFTLKLNISLSKVIPWTICECWHIVQG